MLINKYIDQNFFAKTIDSLLSTSVRVVCYPLSKHLAEVAILVREIQN